MTLEEDDRRSTPASPAIRALAAARARRGAATSPSSSAATARCSASPRQLARHDTPLVGINQGRLRLHHRRRRWASSRARSRRSSPATTRGRAPHHARGRASSATARRSSTGFALNDVIVSRGATAGMVELAGRHRRRVRRPAARRRPDHRLADRIDRLCAVGRRPDPAPGHRRLGAGADRAARPARTGRSSLPDSGEISVEIVAGRDASVNFDMQSLTSLAARRPHPRAPLGRPACASSIRAAGATTRRCARKLHWALRSRA